MGLVKVKSFIKRGWGIFICKHERQDATLQGMIFLVLQSGWGFTD
jgi:hypothetical protein